MNNISLLHSKFKIENLGNTVLQVNIFDGMELEFEDAISMREMICTITKDEKYCVLLDARNSFQVTPEARKLIASKEYSSERTATAFVVNSLANQLIGTFFIRVNKPNSPTKMFSQMDDAFNWLNQEVEKTKSITVNA